MVPLEFIVNRYARPWGLLWAFNTSWKYKIYIVVLVLITCYYLIAELAYYLVTLQTPNEGVMTLASFSYGLNSFLRIMLLLYKNNSLKNLVDEIRAIYRDRPSAKTISTKAERMTKVIGIGLLFPTYATFCIYLLAPLEIMAREYLKTGHVTQWRLPINML